MILSEKNFTCSQVWKNSVIIRYDLDTIIECDGLIFIKRENIIECLSYFDLELSSSHLNFIDKHIINNDLLKFKYINEESQGAKLLTEYVKNNGLEMDVIIRWNAPCLKIVPEYPLAAYFDNCTSRLKRTKKKIEFLYSIAVTFKTSIENDVLTLWCDVLRIDHNSWKKKEKSDMKSLDREDLQYVFLLQSEGIETFLVVVYRSGIPTAYSLMIKSPDSGIWYAAKWGASEEGRKMYDGINCLLYHLELLDYDAKSRNDVLNVDFWGRNNSFYTQIENYSMRRQDVIVRCADGD